MSRKRAVTKCWVPVVRLVGALFSIVRPLSSAMFLNTGMQAQIEKRDVPKSFQRFGFCGTTVISGFAVEIPTATTSLGGIHAGLEQNTKLQVNDDHTSPEALCSLGAAPPQCGPSRLRKKEGALSNRTSCLGIWLASVAFSALI